MINWFCESFGGDASFKLFIIGEGPEHQKLEALIRRHHAEEQVRLLGRLEHNALPPYYHACDVFATASLSEMNSISMLGGYGQRPVCVAAAGFCITKTRLTPA